MSRAYEYRQCRQCREEFKVTRQWQAFCGVKCRRAWNYAEGSWCFYCGEPGVARDHLHPVAAQSAPKRYFQGQETVAACKSCNSMLGPKIFDSVAHRILWLKDHFRRKAGLNEGAVKWSEKEIGELGHGLRARIRKMLMERAKAERRAAYMEAVFFELCRLGVTDDRGVRDRAETPYDFEDDEDR